MPGPDIDVERVVCRLTDLDQQARGPSPSARATGRYGVSWLRSGRHVQGYVNYCPHAGHPLNLRPHQFLTHDGSLILCSSHGALFEKQTGYCVAGPCAGKTLRPVPLKVESGFVMLAEGADAAAFD